MDGEEGGRNRERCTAARSFSEGRKRSRGNFGGSALNQAEVNVERSELNDERNAMIGPRDQQRAGSGDCYRAIYLFAIFISAESSAATSYAKWMAGAA